MKRNVWRSSLLGLIPLAILLVLIAIVIINFGSGTQQRIATIFFINLTIVLGLQIFTGNSGVVSLGSISFMGIGAYGVAVLATPLVVKSTVLPDPPFGLAGIELSPYASVIVAIVVAGLIALVTGLGVTKQVGIPATIASLALLIIVHNVLLNWVGLTRGARAFYGIPIVVTVPVALALAIVALVVARLFRDSNAGLQLRAGGADPLAAASMGVNIRQLRLLAWTLSGAVIGAAGAIYALFLGTISPDDFYFTATFLTLAMLLLGGMRSVTGAVVGSLVVSVGYEIMRNLEPGYALGSISLPSLPGLANFFLGAVIVGVMVLRPNGLVGDDELDEVVARWRRRRRSKLHSDPSDTGNSHAS